MSDQTHLSNFSGEKKAWPVYMTLGNLLSIRRNNSGAMAVLLVALLPIPLKLSTSAPGNRWQRQINADTLQGVFKLVFEPLQHVALKGVNIDCADRKVQRCFPIVSGWIADHMENVALHRGKSNTCPKCAVPLEELRTDAKYQYPARDYARYEHGEREDGRQSPGSESEAAEGTSNTLRIKMGPGVFHGL